MCSPSSGVRFSVRFSSPFDPERTSNPKPGDCLKSRNPRSLLLRQIKADFAEGHEKSRKRLLHEQTKTYVKEKWLRNVSSKFKASWKTLQKKASILSLVRIVLKSNRTLGITPRPDLAAAHLEAQATDRLIEKVWAGRLAVFLRVHWLLLAGFLLFCLVTVPLDLAFGNTAKNYITPQVVLAGTAVLLVDTVVRYLVRVFAREATAGRGALIPLIGPYAVLLFNLVTAFPVELLMQDSRQLQTTRWLMLPRLVRTVCSLNDRHMYRGLIQGYCERHFREEGSVRSFCRLLGGLLAVHFIASIWIAFARIGPEDNWLEK